MTDLPLHWLPKSSDFKAALADLRREAASDPVEGFAALHRLASHQADYFAVLQLDRQLTALRQRAEPWPEVRLALLGDSSVEHLLAPIRVGGARRKLSITTYAGSFGQHRQELMLAGSGLQAFQPEIVLLSVQAASVLPALPLSATAEQAEAAVDAAVRDLRDLWRLAGANLGATVIQQTFLPTAEPLFGEFDAAVPGSPRALISRLNQALAEAARRQGVLLLDAAGWMQTHGRDAWFDRVRWLHAKQAVAPPAAVFYGDLIGRLAAAIRGASKKCLVLDLDNTLWGGVIGDDGLAGIVLGQGSAAGESFVAFQRYVARLAERGVILAVCSKNDPAVAEEAFTHPDMALRRDIFAAFVANWEDKASNLRRIAEMLNIGLDSLVFFDDNPAEREIVRRTLPEVFVPEVPEDSGGFIRCLAESGCFEAAGFTAEDQSRSRQYASNAERRAAAAATDLAGFLRSLGMRLIVQPFTPADLPRIVQLAGKTNQFNLTTRRHNAAAMEAFAQDPACVTLSFRLLDRFGDNGLICAAVAVPDGPRTLRIDTLLMSCRVLGRQVEDEVLSQLVAAARQRGVETLLGEYRPTARNGIVRDLYQKFGFALVNEGADGSALWSLTVADHRTPETAIAIVAPPLQQAGE